MNRTTICKNIKRARLIKSITQAKIASQLGISVPSYCRLERGDTRLNIEMLQKICVVLDLNFGQVISEADNDNSDMDRQDITKLKVEKLKEKIAALDHLILKRQESIKMILSGLETKSW